MKVFLWLVLGVLVAIEGQALAQGPGSADGVEEGLQSGHQHQLRQQELQLKEEPTPAQIRQRELDNRLRTLKIEIDKQKRQRALSGSAAHGDQVIPQQLETPIGDKRDSQDEPRTCVNEPAGQPFLQCLDRIAPKH